MRMEHLITLAGLICFFEGLPYAVLPEHLKAWFRSAQKLPSRRLRALGFSLMLVGLAFVYWGRKHGG